MTERAAHDEAVVDPATHGLEVYAVGGAIRDALLGLPVQDRDYVVVGATPEGMEAVSYTHLTLPTNTVTCRSRWSPYH